MIKKPLKILFKNNIEISNKLGINLNLRPQNLPPITYFKLCEEYENLSKEIINMIFNKFFIICFGSIVY